MANLPEISLAGQLEEFAPILCFAVFLFLGCCALVFMIPAITGVVEKRVVRQSFRSMADALAGSFYGAGLFHLPQVVFEDEGTLFRVRVDRSATSKHRKTLVVSANWENREFRLRLTPEDFGSRYAQFAGIKEIQLGDPEFDQRFLIQTNDEPVLRGMLDNKVREMTSELLQSGPWQEFDLQIVGGTITWRRQFEIQSDRDVEKYVRRFARLYHALANAARKNGAASVPLSADEIRFLTPGQSVDKTGDVETLATNPTRRIPVCLFCGTEIHERIVHCRSCHTAHHRECWKEVGSCTIYGCGEKKYRSRRKKRRWSKRKLESAYRIMD